ncbi:DNA repair exonuclease SbcCD nuclease subunit [Evansella caseinilytica]|uniref:DNA repair exonuclease SbcCD nuclease subunit n=1 Tax=Evansella caseinilytica TaxID=1503961 RepID=A0A1H3K043_9BACI|nr:DNA repair exonuclease [Evansella caseinilytica]SDY45546.1 DNA repair exonuclease SbcCD nuclease subunit [Evansella caseinilytica]
MPRFIHCADVHLGRSIRVSLDLPGHLTQTVQDAAYTSFKQIIAEAIERKVDFVLISGDLYDLEQRSLHGQWFVKKQAERLLEKNIPLFIIHGNHDPLINDNNAVSMPENVHIFTNDVVPVFLETADGDKVYLYGFSYPQKAFHENPLPMYKRVPDDAAFHIGLLHGQERMQQEHEPYAPFKVSELMDKHFDYWALGHIHKRQLLAERPAVVYPGNIQGSHRKETGAKGAYYVELSKQAVELAFISTAPVQWENIVVSIDSLHSIDQLLDLVCTMLHELQRDRLYVIELSIEGQGHLHEQLTGAEEHELLSMINDAAVTRSNHWINRLYVKTLPTIDRSALYQHEHLLGDVVRTVDRLKQTKTAAASLNPVFSHPLLKHYLTDLTEEEIGDIIDGAERKLISALLREVEQS